MSLMIASTTMLKMIGESMSPPHRTPQPTSKCVCLDAGGMHGVCVCVTAPFDHCGTSHEGHLPWCLRLLVAGLGAVPDRLTLSMPKLLLNE
jgi:hypothetical protein